jgi:membrane protein DedA with SNARE-associated domain
MAVAKEKEQKEQKEPFWKRHLVALIVGGFAVLLVVIVVGQLLDDGDIANWLADIPEQWAYVVCFLFIWFDAVIPIFPGETTLSAASTIASAGGLQLGLVMLAGALGAIVGDSSLFWIARMSATKMRPKLDKALENPKVKVAWDGLNRSPGLLIVAGRYVPGMRFAVNVSMGLSDMPYRRFLGWSALSGVLWSVYTCALAYWVSTTLAGFPLASLIISSLITSGALAAVYFVDRRKRKEAKDPKPTDAAAEPASPPSIVGSEN